MGHIKVDLRSRLYIDSLSKDAMGASYSLKPDMNSGLKHRRPDRRITATGSNPPSSV